MEEQKGKRAPKHPKVVGWTCFGIGIAAFALIAVGLLFWRNPFYAKVIDASVQAWDPETADDERVPYIRVDHMELQDTGYYSVDKDGQVCGRYYIGHIGPYSVFVAMSPSVEVGDREGLTDMSVEGRWVSAETIVSRAAGEKGLSVAEYTGKYSICRQQIRTGDTGRAADFLVYAIAAAAGIGFLLLGKIFITQKETEG